jgi:hypothetical protein
MATCCPALLTQNISLSLSPVTWDPIAGPSEHWRKKFNYVKRGRRGHFAITNSRCFHPHPGRKQFQCYFHKISHDALRKLWNGGDRDRCSFPLV